MQKALFIFIVAASFFIGCEQVASTSESKNSNREIEGTWKLISGTLIEKGDTTVTDYTKHRSFIKIINKTHFAFLNHDLQKGKDSATAAFGAGGGTYILSGNQYTEHLEYCTDRAWEGHDFTFTITIQNDTLTQSGVEKIESEGIKRMNIEKYVKQ